LSMTKYLDSIGGCATWCTALGDKCEVFSSKYISTDSSFDEDGYKCEFAYSNYTNYQETKTGWLLWTKKTTTQSARSVTTVAQNSPEDECPIVWRKWPWTGDDSLRTWMATLSTVQNDKDGWKAIDNDESTMAKTLNSNSNAYPYLLLDVGRAMRVTKVSVLGGADPFGNPLMNLDVRVGNTSNVGFDVNSKITNNIRCGVFYGPTVIPDQWVEIDCGFEDGIYGRYLSLQLQERFLMPSNSALHIKEVEIEGWARTCNKDV